MVHSGRCSIRFSAKVVTGPSALQNHKNLWVPAATRGSRCLETKLPSTHLGCPKTLGQMGRENLHPPKPTWLGGKTPFLYNRKYIFIHGCFLMVLCLFSGFFKAPPYTRMEKGFKDLDVLSQNSICLTFHYKPNPPNPVASCNHFMNSSKTKQPNTLFVSSGPNPGWLFYIGGYTKHDTGLIISREKDPVMVTCHVRLSLSSNDLSPHLSRPSALPLVQPPHPSVPNL